VFLGFWSIIPLYIQNTFQSETWSVQVTIQPEIQSKIEIHSIIQSKIEIDEHSVENRDFWLNMINEYI
jgi:hypothetical protein